MHRMARYALLTVIALGFCVSHSFAQGLVSMPETVVAVEQPVMQAPQATMTYSGVAAAPQSGGRLKDLLAKCGYYCGATQFTMGCGNIRTEGIFVFGSCRSFFTQPCLPQNPGPIDYGSPKTGGVAAYNMNSNPAASCPTCH